MNLGDGTAADILDRTDGVGVITFVGRTVITGVGYHLSVVRGHLRDTVCLEARLDLTGDELRSLRRLQREQDPKSPFVFTSEPRSITH